jgi:hypothetical protein
VYIGHGAGTTVMSWTIAPLTYDTPLVTVWTEVHNQIRRSNIDLHALHGLSCIQPGIGDWLGIPRAGKHAHYAQYSMHYAQYSMHYAQYSMHCAP